MDSTTRKWVAALKDAHPHLPDKLSATLEKRHIETLKPWLERVKKLRQKCRDLEEDTSRILPVILSIDGMKAKERKAWHELFVCLSASMAKISYKHWRVHSEGSDALGLEDVLNYLPVVFLYVLSKYDPYPGTDDHEDDFSASDDGRVKLITWLHIDAGGHVKTYLQQHAYTIGRGTSYIHRLRQKIRQTQDETFVQEGRQPSQEEVTDELAEKYFGSLVSRSTLSNHVRTLTKGQVVVSTSDTVSGNEDGLTYGDFITTSTANVDGIYDPAEYLENRLASHPTMLSACQKLLYTNKRLSLTERFYFQ